MKPFSHLHTHSHYSLLTALPKIPELVKAAKDDGMEALALTDNGNLYGAIEFYKECNKNDIKPIIGVDAYVALRTRFDKQAGIDNLRHRLILLAENEKGYKNLIKLVTLGNVEGFYYKPRIDTEILEKYGEGLIVISPSDNGSISYYLKGGDEKKALELLKKYKKIFADKFFIELTHHPEIPNHIEYTKKLLKFARDNNVPVVAGHDIFYLNAEDRKARNTLLSVQNHGERDRNSSWNDMEEDFSFKTQKEMNQFFQDIPEALENNKKIVDMCNLKLKFGSWVFPDYVVESGKSYDDELRDLVYKGIKRRELEETKEVFERIEYELKVIKDKGYSPYFLVVGDLLNYAYQNKILTTIRGSVAGSMVTYLAGITNVNPIEYKLPFERFLNPERPSAPDIDMDIADNKRDEMIEYARKKYGADKVAQIGTFGTMMARGAVRDVARALGYSYGTGDKIAKLIPFGSQGFPMTLKRAFEMVPELKNLYEKDTEVREIVDMAKKIEGCARHISVHAAGVVISPTEVTDYTPLQFDTKGEEKLITQFDMHSVEDAGLLKFDFLGLKNLSILADTVERIEAIEGKTIDPEKIPLDDKKTFEILARGKTEGLFQLNGGGMTKFLMDLKPTTIHDINAMVALYRPGPMEVIPEYIKRKNNPSCISYPDPRMKKYLKESYGLIVYQDDLLLSAIELAGYSWLEADKFRKAVGKKIPKEMAAQKEKLLNGIVKNGQTKEFAEELWRLFEPFQAYGFNKAHAASYGRIAYQTAYFKANWPAIYMSAILTADSGDTERIGELISECERMGIPVLGPSVNKSFKGFSVVREENKPDTIRFGLATIKNFGEGISQEIVRERKTNGEFKTLTDFLERVQIKSLNKKSLESLIKSGGLDEFGDRGVILANLERLLSYHKEHAKKEENQESLFGLMPDSSSIPSLRLDESPKATMRDKLLWEKELLGLYLSGHPLDEHKEKIKKRDTDIKKIKKEFPEGTKATIIGIVDGVKEIITKKNEKMLFTQISDLSDSIEVVVFPKAYNEFKEIIEPGVCVALVGTVSKRKDEISLLLEKIKRI